MDTPRPPWSHGRLVTFLPRSLAAAALLLAAAAPLRAEEKGPPLAVPFQTGRPFADALRKAKAEKKGVMVDVYAVWCGPCKLMDRTTFSDAAVAAWVTANFVPVKVDAEKGEGRKIAQRYMVTSFPSVLFLDAAGNEIDRLVAVYPPDAFVTTGKAILAGRTPLLEALAALRKSWVPQDAATVAQELVRRKDLPPLRPILGRLLGAVGRTGRLLTALAAALGLAAFLVARHRAPRRTDAPCAPPHRVSSPNVDWRRPACSMVPRGVMPPPSSTRNTASA
ncbi:MAG TPA: thioredoxin family protein, partial [Thermoanaerobaculia bacterium]|nr:thioredoxin family protein [Thermoanaerobaculia bacterium]